MATDERDPDRPDDRRRDDYADQPHYERPHRGGMILAFGIISLTLFTCVVGLVFGILAWVMGNNDLRGMAEGEVDPEGRQLTQVGKILGMVGVILSLVYTVGIILYFAVAFAFIAAVPKPAPAPAPVPQTAPAPPAKGAPVLP